MFAKTLVTAVLAAVVLCGCNPDETKVTVNASALKSAAEGKAATAKVELRLDSVITFESNVPEKVRRVALPFLGKGAKIQIEAIENKSSSGEGAGDAAKKKDRQTRFIATFDVPVGTASALQKAPPSILQLEYAPEDKTFRLVYGPGMSSLNSALKAMDSSFMLEYSGGCINGVLFATYKTTVNVLNDDVVALGVAAVDVNGKPVIAGTVDTSAQSLLIDYGNKFYVDKAPCFMFGGLPSMSSRSPKWKGE